MHRSCGHGRGNRAALDIPEVMIKTLVKHPRKASPSSQRMPKS